MFSGNWDFGLANDVRSENDDAEEVEGTWHSSSLMKTRMKLSREVGKKVYARWINSFET